MEGSVAAAPPTQGTPTQSAQPPASGQGAGQGQATGGDSGFWGNFPNVPESQRGLLEPHLKDVQGYVTRLEQGQAPYKPLMDVVDPNTVGDLVGFLNNYTQNPMETIMGLIANQHQQGAIQNPEFSLEALQSLLQGGGQPAPQPGAEQQGDMPPWAQNLATQVSQLVQGEEARQQAENQRQAQAQEAENQRVLAEGMGFIREQLKAAGVPETNKDGTPFISDQRLVGGLIAHKGDPNAVIAEFTSLRDALVGDFTAQNGGQRQGPTVQGEVPNVPAPKTGNSRDPFKKATAAAHQRLAMANQATAQGQGE